MPHITSTLTAPQEYTIWKEVVKGEKSPVRSIRIEGGANVASKHFVTLDGVVTEVTDEQVELLRTIPAFIEHEKLGFVKVHRVSKASTKDMEAADESAPITPVTAKKKRLANPMKSGN